MILTSRAFSDLVGAIYEAILRPETWSPTLERLCAALGTPAASIHVIDPIAQRTRFVTQYGGDPVYDALAITKYAAMNPAGAAVLLGELDQPLGLFDLIDEDELVETRWYKEWCVPQRYHDMMGAIIAKRPTEIGALSSVRLVDQPRFGEAERELFALIAPHVRRSVTISALLEQRSMERDDFSAVMDELGAAIVLATGAGAVVKANRAAEALAAAGSILRIGRQGLGLLDPGADLGLRKALAASSDEPRFVGVEAEGGGAHVVAVLTIDGRRDLHAVVVHAREPELPPLGRLLQAAFKLTPREVGVLTKLLEGNDIGEVADVLGVARTTAKTHLERIFQKTGTNRQADLVARVMQAMPPVRMQ